MNLDFCSSCCLGKAHRLPSHSSNTVYENPFDLICSDLWGPTPIVSSTGFNYYISFIDANTRFTWLFLLKKKSEALPTFLSFKNMAELQFNAKIKSFQTDWGGAFRSFPKVLQDFGITHRVICPHTHNQNGVVERKHRHIVELGLTFLAHASLPFKFWDQAFLTAVYLINRLPSASIGKEIPHTKLLKHSPDYSFLKVFGCACFPLLRPYNSHKLEFRSHECVFLGYSSNHKGYKCLSPTGRTFISKDVVFNELRFPYHELFDSPNPSPSHPSLPLPPIPILNQPPICPQNPMIPQPTPPHSLQSHQPPIHFTSPSPSSAHNSPSSTSTPSGSSSQRSLANDLPNTPFPFPTSSSTAGPTNIHPMITRAKAGITRPCINPTLLLAHAEPKTVKTVIADPNWYSAMSAE